MIGLMTVLLLAQTDDEDLTPGTFVENLKHIGSLMGGAEKDLGAGDLKDAEGKQRQAIDKLAKLIKQVKAKAPLDGRETSKPVDRTAKPNEPNRSERPSKFVNKSFMHGWDADLPPREKAAAMNDRRLLEAIPPEFQRMWDDYVRETHR